MRKFIAFDIGGTLIKYGVLTDKGNFLERNETATQAEFGGPEVLRKVKEIGDGLIKRYSIGGICISTAGQVDSKKGEILYASSLIPEYTGTLIKKELEAYFRLPVEVENDVNCAGLAESWIGKGRDAKSLFCLTVGTGIGGSYIIDSCSKKKRNAPIIPASFKFPAISIFVFFKIAGMISFFNCFLINGYK